jgi:hypothetical protein
MHTPTTAALTTTARRQREQAESYAQHVAELRSLPATPDAALRPLLVALRGF